MAEVYLIHVDPDRYNMADRLPQVGDEIFISQRDGTIHRGIVQEDQRIHFGERSMSYDDFFRYSIWNKIQTYLRANSVRQTQADKIRISRELQHLHFELRKAKALRKAGRTLSFEGEGGRRRKTRLRKSRRRKSRR